MEHSQLVPRPYRVFGHSTVFNHTKRGQWSSTEPFQVSVRAYSAEDAAFQVSAVIRHDDFFHIDGVMPDEDSLDKHGLVTLEQLRGGRRVVESRTTDGST